MTIVPLNKKVLVAQNSQEAKSEFGIILDSAKSVRDNQTGTVLAVGNRVENVTVGDKILLDWNKATIVSVGGDQRVMIDEKDIIAVLD